MFYKSEIQNFYLICLDFSLGRIVKHKHNSLKCSRNANYEMIVNIKSIYELFTGKSDQEETKQRDLNCCPAVFWYFSNTPVLMYQWKQFRKPEGLCICITIEIHCMPCYLLWHSSLSDSLPTNCQRIPSNGISILPQLAVVQPSCRNLKEMVSGS